MNNWWLLHNCCHVKLNLHNPLFIPNTSSCWWCRIMSLIWFLLWLNCEKWNNLYRSCRRSLQFPFGQIKGRNENNNDTTNEFLNSEQLHFNNWPQWSEFLLRSHIDYLEMTLLLRIHDDRYFKLLQEECIEIKMYRFCSTTTTKSNQQATNSTW